jgi:nucleoside-diphosphate-sugar epimerase
MTLLLTGGSGFLGRHVLAQLEGRPLRLFVLPDDPALPELRKQAEVVTGDVTRPESLSRALKGVTQVVHLPGHVNGGRGRAETFMAVNAQGTANLAQAARAAGVAQFVYTSSITVYGYVGDADEATPLVFTPGYPASKIHAERAVRQLLPAQATILRLPLVLGAGDTGFMCPALHGFQEAGRVVLVGSGLAPWSVLAASDAAQAIALCLAKPETRGRTYNVLGETVTNGELLRAMGAGVGCTKETRLPYTVAWVMAALTELVGRDDLTRVQVQALSGPLAMNGDRFARLGFVAKTGWREALARAIAWCVEMQPGGPSSRDSA